GPLHQKLLISSDTTPGHLSNLLSELGAYDKPDASTSSNLFSVSKRGSVSRQHIQGFDISNDNGDNSIFNDSTISAEPPSSPGKRSNSPPILWRTSTRVVLASELPAGLESVFLNPNIKSYPILGASETDTQTQDVRSSISTPRISSPK